MAKGMNQLFEDILSGKFQGEAASNIQEGVRGLGRHLSGWFSYNGHARTEYTTQIQGSIDEQYFHFVNFLAFLKRNYLDGSFYKQPPLFRVQGWNGPEPKEGTVVTCRPKQSTSYWTSNDDPVVAGRERLPNSHEVVLTNPSSGDCIYSYKVGEELLKSFAKYKSRLDDGLKRTLQVTVSDIEEGRVEREFILYHGKDRKPFKAKVHEVRF
jgi:hypothetical protein